MLAYRCEDPVRKHALESDLLFLMLAWLWGDGNGFGRSRLAGTESIAREKKKGI